MLACLAYMSERSQEFSTSENIELIELVDMTGLGEYTITGCIGSSEIDGMDCLGILFIDSLNEKGTSGHDIRLINSNYNPHQIELYSLQTLLLR
jgi:hypothetical protein